MSRTVTGQKIGILGGTGWPSTALYYAELCRRSEARALATDASIVPSTPEMCIESLDLRHAVSLIGTDGDEASWEHFDAYHRLALIRLEASGARIALMASNTPHHRFASIVEGVGISVINMFEAVAAHCASAGHDQVLIIGTALTMRSPALREAFHGYGIDAQAPDDPREREAVLDVIAQLQRGHADGAAQRVSSTVQSAWARQFSGQPVVCLACTELPLAFVAFQGYSTFDRDGVHYVNTPIIHIETALEYLLARG